MAHRLSQDEPSVTALQETLYSSRNSTRRWLHTSRREWIRDALRRHAGRSRHSALEVGPGSGVYLPLLCELFDQVVGSDVSEEHLANLDRVVETQSNLELVSDDIAASELDSDSFDLILCSEVIEHVGDPQAAMRHMHRLLKPGGVLVISTPQPYSPIELLGRIAFKPGFITIVRLIYREPVLPPGHISLMSRRRLLDLIRAVGLDPVEEQASGVYVPGLAEVGGNFALKLALRIERRARAGRLRPLLWTQFHVAAK